MSNDSSSQPEKIPQESHNTTDIVRPESSVKQGHTQVPWGPWASILYALVIYFAAQFLAAIIIFAAASLFMGWNPSEIETWIASAISAQFWFVLVAEALTFAAIWWFVRLRGSNLRAIGWKRIRFRNVFQALGGFAVYFVAYAIILSIALQLIPSLNVDQKQELGFDNATGTLALVLTFFSLVVFPPIVEELVFRGFVYTGLRGKFKPLLAALFTSALFAVAHLQFGSGKPLLWVAAIDTFILSLVLCYLRQKTDSLWPGIMLHALKNCIAFTSLFLLTSH